MSTHHRRFSELFVQLGLPGEEKGIAAFIQTHSPLDSATRLEDAPFWTSQQASLLHEHLQDDADWAEVADQLSLALRAVES
ncbi:DUF2789 family protein [Bradyrhizobium sp.]|uniref:DUF2789 family protein n=1 Tax=Bradyrhizobium sp. TaxID=376 RepID=UPI0027327DD5|nr:DUF2789 family protein [Bradyrhizobium sp.]MDP3690595.1 DUF2789 family protein [Bradyrhizobium sp.]